MKARRSGTAFIAVLIAAGSMITTAKAAATCAPAAGGGEWPSYGRTLSNDRDQVGETKIGPSNAAALKAAWSVPASAAGGVGGQLNSTVAVVDGCVFLGTSRGTVSAFNADTGQAVWATQESPAGSLGTMFAPAVVDHTVYIVDGQAGAPYVVALDAATGTVLWRTLLWQQALDGEPDYFGVNASIVAFDGMLFVPLVGNDLADFSHPSFYILRASDGAVLKKTNVIAQEYWTDLYSGGGIWATAVVDEATKYLYVGTTNPYNKRAEHPYANALIKIDVDPSRDVTFGHVVGHYKGDHDYTDANYYTTECQTLGEAVPVGYSNFCGQIDVDFGASPNLFTNSEGRTVVANLQKSCTFHAIDAETMKVIWKSTNPEFGGAGSCAGTSAYDDHGIYVGESDGAVHAFNKDTGDVLWTTNFTTQGGHYQPMSVANGVVYTTTNDAHLVAIDATTGEILLNAVMADSSGNTCASTQGGGVTIARNTVFVACDAGSGADGILFAYRLP